MFHIPCNCLPKAFVLADDNRNESGKLCCETAVASTHLCCCHQILLFQSPYTGTEQCGQVPFLMFFLFTPQMLSVFSNTFLSAQFNELWHISWLFWNVAHNHLFCQRLLWLLLVTQDMGASQSSVCQVFFNQYFLLSFFAKLITLYVSLVASFCLWGWDRGGRAFGKGWCWSRFKPDFHLGPCPGAQFYTFKEMDFFIEKRHQNCHWCCCIKFVLTKWSNNKLSLISRVRFSDKLGLTRRLLDYLMKNSLTTFKT